MAGEPPGVDRITYATPSARRGTQGLEIACGVLCCMFAAVWLIVTGFGGLIFGVCGGLASLTSGASSAAVLSLFLLGYGLASGMFYLVTGIQIQRGRIAWAWAAAIVLALQTFAHLAVVVWNEMMSFTSLSSNPVGAVIVLVPTGLSVALVGLLIWLIVKDRELSKAWRAQHLPPGR
jgi:hypothetical protein